MCNKRNNGIEQNEVTTNTTKIYDIAIIKNEITLQIIDELTQAAVNNKMEVIQKYIGNFLISPNQPLRIKPQNTRLLHIAAHRGQFEIVCYLIQMGADVNI